MSIVIRLDLPALERLLGGDTVTEIDIRKGIVQEFAKRHLVAIAKDKEFAEFVEREAKIARAALHDALREHVGTYKDRGFHTEAVTLSEATRASIEAEAMRRFQKLIEDVVSKVWTEKCEPKLEPWIDRLLIGCVSTRVKEAVEKLSGDTIKSAVQARLDQIKETLKA